MFFFSINQEKPLRISGEPAKVDHAKQLVFDLILDKEAFNSNSRPNFNSGNGAPPGSEQAEVFVPKTAVGVVIGKGGEMIKKIQGETGCKLQFIQGKGDGPGDRRCIISGTKQQVDDAKRTIEDLIESVMVSLIKKSKILYTMIKKRNKRGKIISRPTAKQPKQPKSQQSEFKFDK